MKAPKLEIEVLRLSCCEEEGRSQKEGAKRSAFTTMRCSLTNMYQLIYIVRLDERTNNLYILARKTIEREIDPNGE